MPHLRLVLISDTHGLHDQLVIPDGDVLVHSGDLSSHGREDEIRAAGEFLAQLPHREKVVIAGNHDFLFEQQPDLARELIGEVTYLRDTGTVIDGLRFWGSPWQPWFHDWAFNLERGPELAAKWKCIPTETDILITHGPPMGIMDRTVRGLDVGCEELLKAVRQVQPRLHAFGHIHEQRGHLQDGPTLFVNASICNFRYEPVHSAIVVDWDADGPRAVSSS